MIVRRELSTGLENSQLIIKGTYMILICETKANFTQKLSVFLQEEIQKKSLKIYFVLQADMHLPIHVLSKSSCFINNLYTVAVPYSVSS